ncbi:RusA family crossover junction endodeoxyribonuclease [Singulisphaera rosea]
MTTTIRLPYPPSVNHLYATNWKTKMRFKSRAYKKWIESAGWELRSQRPKSHSGKVVVTYFVKKRDNRKRDIDNLAKPLLDLLVSHQVIKDDSQVTALHCSWADHGEGVTVLIDELSG